jgi:hypothetical protein
MDVHPWTNYEIARLQNEERLVRAQQAQRAVSIEEQPAKVGARPSTAARVLRRIRRRAPAEAPAPVRPRAV